MTMHTFFHLEDSRINQILFQKTFEDIAQVISAQSIGDALQLIADEPDITCFIVDYKLHDGDGLTFVQKIRSIQKYADAPVIVLTSTLTDEIKRHAHEAGVNESLDKMVSNKDLRRILINQIRNPHIKRIKGQKHYIPCITYESDAKYYQFCPALKELVEADTAEEAEDQMRTIIRKAISSRDGSSIIEVHAISHCTHVVEG